MVRGEAVRVDDGHIPGRPQVDEGDVGVPVHPEAEADLLPRPVDFLFREQLGLEGRRGGRTGLDSPWRHRGTLPAGFRGGLPLQEAGEGGVLPDGGRGRAEPDPLHRVQEADAHRDLPSQVPQVPEEERLGSGELAHLLGHPGEAVVQPQPPLAPDLAQLGPLHHLEPRRPAEAGQLHVQAVRQEEAKLVLPPVQHHELPHPEPLPLEGGARGQIPRKPLHALLESGRPGGGGKTRPQDGHRPDDHTRETERASHGDGLLPGRREP